MDTNMTPQATPMERNKKSAPVHQKYLLDLAKAFPVHSGEESHDVARSLLRLWVIFGDTDCPESWSGSDMSLVRKEVHLEYM